MLWWLCVGGSVAIIKPIVQEDHSRERSLSMVPRRPVGNLPQETDGISPEVVGPAPHDPQCFQTFVRDCNSTPPKGTPPGFKELIGSQKTNRQRGGALAGAICVTVITLVI